MWVGLQISEEKNCIFGKKLVGPENDEEKKCNLWKKFVGGYRITAGTNFRHTFRKYLLDPPLVRTKSDHCMTFISSFDEKDPLEVGIESGKTRHKTWSAEKIPSRTYPSLSLSHPQAQTNLFSPAQYEKVENNFHPCLPSFPNWHSCNNFSPVSKLEKCHPTRAFPLMYERNEDKKPELWWFNHRGEWSCRYWMALLDIPHGDIRPLT